MKIRLLDESKRLYKFELTDEEVCRHIYVYLSSTNPELSCSDIKRNKISKEYVAHYIKHNGTEVNISVGFGNLKRYFGTRILAVVDGGIWFNRIIPKNKPLPKPTD